MRLNLGCNIFKINGFINIDIDPTVSPDLCVNLALIKNHFQENSIDFIFAGHVLEHLPIMDGVFLLRDCYSILRSGSTIIVVVPDYTKITKDITKDEKIILGGDLSEFGRHKSLYSASRLEKLFKDAGFSFYYEIKDLTKVPYLLVSDINNPVPDPWQTAFIGLKI